MIIALAGRRTDAPDAETPRFPLENTERVRRRLRELFEARGATALVSSGACGSDLLAHEVAGALNLRRRIVLPFDRAKFRETSVVDRPGDWGPIYDRVCDALEPAGDLVVLREVGGESKAYALANLAILDEALKLAEALAREPGRPAKVAPNRLVLAVTVWEGKPRGDDDMTAAFAAEARAREIDVAEVLTLG